MAVAFVQAVTDANDTAGNDALTEITIGSGSDRCLALSISHRGSTTGYSASSSVDGALTTDETLTVSSAASAFGRAVTFLYLLNPTTGAHTVTVSADSGDVHGIYTQVELTGVDPDVPLGTPVSDSGTSGTSSSATVSAPDDALVLDGVSIRLTSAPTVGADQTERSSSIIASTVNVFGATSTQPGTVSGDVMSWTHGNAQHALLAVPFLPAPEVASGYTYGVGSVDPTLSTGLPSSPPTLASGVPAANPSLSTGLPASPATLASGPPESGSTYTYGA